jgi:hypothetical protein
MSQNFKGIEESSVTKGISKEQLITNILQTIESLTPSEIKPVSEDMIVSLYNMKKEIMELDPN